MEKIEENINVTNIISDKSTMSFFGDELKRKVTKIREWYWGIYTATSPSDLSKTELTSKENEMLNSASRWHRNSHFRLILLFDFLFDKHGIKLINSQLNATQLN